MFFAKRDRNRTSDTNAPRWANKLPVINVFGLPFAPIIVVQTYDEAPAANSSAVAPHAEGADPAKAGESGDTALADAECRLTRRERRSWRRLAKHLHSDEG